MRKILKILLVILLLNVIILTGCSTTKVYNTIKKEPGVLDIAFEMSDDSIRCEIILKENIMVKDITPFIKRNLRIVRNNFRNKDVLIRVKQNKEVLGSYLYKR